MSLLPWISTLLLEMGGFLVISLVGGVVYWISHLSSRVIRWVKIAFATFATAVMTVLFAPSLGNMAPLPVTTSLLIILGASALQTAIECAITGQDTLLTDHLARSFFSYICLTLVAYFLFCFIDSVLIHFSAVWNWDLRAIVIGYLAGLILAPVSISFYRWAFQNITLRPGIDRVLRDEERA